jgi:hypothetical protein
MKYNTKELTDGKGAEKIVLTPSLYGAKCKGNGQHKNIERRCDECNFFLECFPNIIEIIQGK